MNFKTQIIAPFLLLLSLSAFSQTGWEIGLQGGTNFANSWASYSGAQTSLNGFSISTKSAWNFHRNFALEMSAGTTVRESMGEYGYGYGGRCGFGLMGCFPTVLYQPTKQIDIEHQTRIRYKLLANRRVQPWIAGGFTQLFGLKALKGDQQNTVSQTQTKGDFIAPSQVFPTEPDRHAAALVYAAGVRFKLANRLSLDVEGNVRHFAFGNYTYSRNMMGSTQIGLVLDL